MRTKAVPQPVSLEALTDAHRAVALVPGATDDCCARVQRRGPAQDRTAAEDWLAFLTALELLERTDRGYTRRPVDIDIDVLAGRFEQRVYAVPEILAVLEDGKATADAVFESTASIVPTWERNRLPEWRSTWRDRTERVLEWAAVFGLVVTDQSSQYDRR